MTRCLSAAAQSTNPFVAAGVAPVAAPSNPFQSNGRVANVAAAAGVFIYMYMCVSICKCVVHVVTPQSVYSDNENLFMSKSDLLCRPRLD